MNEEKKAIGITSKGETKMIDTSFGWVLALTKDLISLEVTGGIRTVNCEDNPIKKLILPPTVKNLSCDYGVIDYIASDIKNISIFYR
jgi:hypothetical protein